MRVKRTRKGTPVLAECGGDRSNTGRAQIVCGPNGERIKPLTVPRGYANGVHATFVARVGIHIITAGHNRRGEIVSIRQIDGFGGIDSYTGEPDPDLLQTTEVGWIENGESEYDSHFEDAVQAALDKATCYHCREAHYTA